MSQLLQKLVQYGNPGLAVALQEQRKVLLVASKAKQPEMTQLQQVLQPVAEPMMAAGTLADNRRSPAFQQLKVVAEGLQSLSWLAYTGPSCGLHLPAQHIGESWNAAEFFANKLLKEFRGADETQVAWVKALKELFSSLQSYVRLHHAAGLKWNPAGCSLAEAQSAAAAAAAPAAAPKPAAARPGPGAPPPPPPPPPSREVLDQLAAKKATAAAAGAAAGAAAAGGGGGGMNEVLRAIQQGGSGVTSGLRKVTDDMKSKNRTDSSGRVAAPARSAAAGTGSSSGPAAAAVGPPRFELERERKWVIENQVDAKELVVELQNPKQSVYIYNCSGSVVQVKGKCNAISIDKCRKTGVVFEDVIASCELINCAALQVQCTGAVPTVSIDKCDGVQVYIPAALAANPDLQVVTAKSSEMNVLVTPADPEAEDVQEHAVPEQFISTFKNGKLVTTAACHGGG